jgi:SPX domain protein involved in polyphosphate accumulation
MTQAIDFEQLLNIKQAAAFSGRPEQTIRNYLGLNPKAPGESRLPNAKKVKKGNKEIWQIPVKDLFEAGLMQEVKGEKEEFSTPKLLEKISNLEQTNRELEQKVKEQAKALEKTKDQAELEQAVKDLKKDIAHNRELLEAKEQSLRDLRLAMGLSIETKETQEARRAGLFSRLSGNRKPKN